jgi:hypothetical protein
MSDQTPILNAGDPVFYTGDKFKQELFTKDGKPLRGWIHSRVRGNPNMFVVEFPEAKEPDYLMSIRVLSKWRPPKSEKHEGPEIQPRRRKATEEET